MASLKKILKHYIYQRSRVTINELEVLARDNGYKVSNMERRMREICQEGLINPILSPKRFIVGYELVNNPKDINKPYRLSWREELRRKQEKAKIARMPRNSQGRIIAC